MFALPGASDATASHETHFVTDRHATQIPRHRAHEHALATTPAHLLAADAHAHAQGLRALPPCHA
eukprot:2485935-Alexandrium_andersonii.AAC.1